MFSSGFSRTCLQVLLSSGACGRFGVEICVFDVEYGGRRRQTWSSGRPNLQNWSIAEAPEQPEGRAAAAERLRGSHEQHDGHLLAPAAHRAHRSDQDAAFLMAGKRCALEEDHQTPSAGAACVAVCTVLCGVDPGPQGVAVHERPIRRVLEERDVGRDSFRPRSFSYCCVKGVCSVRFPFCYRPTHARARCWSRESRLKSVGRQPRETDELPLRSSPSLVSRFRRAVFTVVDLCYPFRKGV